MKNKLGQFDHLSLNDILNNSAENLELTRKVNKEICNIQNLMNYTLRVNFKDWGSQTPNGVNLAPNNLCLKELLKILLNAKDVLLKHS